MTRDVIVLTPTPPDRATLLAGLFAGGPDLRVDTAAESAVTQLCAPDGRPLVAIEASALVRVPAEVRRLLGVDTEGPVWWTEARASTAVPEAYALARSFAGRLATVLGGTVWPGGTVTTDVVPLRTDITAVPVPDTGIPAVDVLTPRALVVMQDRPVVPLSTWLADALRHAADGDRALQLVTPPASRLTLPLRTALRGLPHRWVVRDERQGLYDGLSGVRLRWSGGIFGPDLDERGAAILVEPFREPVAGAVRQLVLQARTRHHPDAELLLGGALEAVFRRLTGAAPRGWGTAEPAGNPWSRRQLTELARARAPRPTLLTVVGAGALATVRVLRTREGVEEDVTVVVGDTSTAGEGSRAGDGRGAGAGSDAVGPDAVGPDAMGPDAVGPDAVEGVARELHARHGLVSLLASYRSGRADLTVPARFEAPPVPVRLLVPEDSARGGAGIPASVRLGAGTGAARLYRLGDGSDAVAAWRALERLTGEGGAGGGAGSGPGAGRSRG
ncbi:DUF6177 family protein [Streptomyces sp. NPDC058426]|uniref:DUF6177 family protein n=1 Tax=Streptomyces sp. NPDC058426 TaxID=3346493 RepID=UPI00366420A9